MKRRWDGSLGWSPMETAPRDGTYILLGTTGPSSPGAPRMVVARFDRAIAGAACRDVWVSVHWGAVSLPPFAPTRWMHLPSDTTHCPICGGAGWRWGYSPERGEDDTRHNCMNCDGTGDVPAPTMEAPDADR